MKAVIYARYSDDNQREESIEGQLRECYEYAKRHGIEVIAEYIDRAMTGRNDNRPDFQRMIKESDSKAFDLIIVWKLDRFARDKYDSALYKGMLLKKGIRVVSAAESIPEGAEGVLLESLLEGLAQYYSMDLSIKTKRGMKENALKRKWNGGHVPIGYRVNDEHMLEIDPATAPLVREIFQMTYDGMSMKEIYRNLQGRGIRRGNGNAISYSSIRVLLGNRIYIGEHRSMDVVIEGGVPAIIERSLFDAVQTELERNAKACARHTADEKYLLTTKLFCGKCGSMMVAQAGTSRTGKVYRYYDCVKRKKRLCDKEMLPKVPLENFVVQKTMQLILQDDVVDHLAKVLFELQEQGSTVIPMLEQQYKEKQKEIENILGAIQKGHGVNLLLERLDLLEKQRDEIQAAIEKERIKRPVFTQEQFRMALCRYRTLDISTEEGKQKIIDTFVNSIYVYDDHFKIIYNTNGKEETVTLEELSCSNDISRGEPKNSVHASVRNFYLLPLHSSLFTFH